MTVQLKQLLVTADMNATGYTRGAQQKKAADEAMIQSGRQAVFVFQEADNKLSQSGDVLARLSRQYVDGFANAQRFATAVDSLTRGVERGRIEISQASTILDGIYRKYGMMADASKIAERGQIELARAVERANQRFQEQRRIVPANDVAVVGGVGGRNFAATNAMFQFQDIAMTAAMGMNPAMIGLQQGSQLAGAYAGMSGREALSTSLAGLAGMVNPVSLIAIGLTTAAAAAIQFGQGLFGAGKEAENLDKVMKRHQETVKALGDQWGGVLDKQLQYGQRSSAVVGFGAEMSAAQIRDALRRQIPDVLQSITGAAGANLDAIGGGRAFRSNPMFGLLTEDVDRLVRAAKEGSPDIVGLTRRISEMARASDNPGIRKLADDIILAITPVEELSRKLLEVERAATQLFNSVGPNGMALSQGRVAQNDNSAAALFESQNRIAAERSRQAFQAQLSGITARSPAERAEAARLSEASRYDMSETAAARRQRIEQAGLLALAQSEQQLLDARRERARALDASMAQQQVELSLIGKTISEQERLRMEHRLIAELRAEAARNGTAVDEDEIRRIREKSSEYGRLMEQMAAQRALLGQDREIAALDKRLSLVGQSEAAQVRSNALVQAEIRLRESGIALGSHEAELYRRKAEYIALQNDELRKQEAALARVRGAAEGTIDSFVDILAGGDLADGLSSILKDWSKTILQLGVANPLKNSLLGTNYETMNDIGGIGGMFSKLLGGGMTTSAMSVTATSVLINSGLGAGGPGGLFGLGTGGFRENTTLGGLLGAGGAANDNINLSGSGAGLAWNFWKSKGLADHQVAGILGNIKAESGFNPLAVGDGGNAFGLYQHNDRRFNLFNAIGGKGNLGDELAQHRFAYSELMGPENRAWLALKNATDVRGATKAFAGFERPSGFSWDNPEAAHNFVGRLNGANEALTKFGGGVSSAERGLGGLGDGLKDMSTGLNKFGGELSKVSLGSGGGGGLGGFNWSSLFSSSWTPNTTLGSFLINGFSRGGPTGGSNPARVAGLVHEQEYVFDAASTARIGVDTLDALRRNALGGWRDGGLGTVGGVGRKPLVPARQMAGPAGGGGQTVRVVNEFIVSYDEKGNPRAEMREVAREEASNHMKSGFEAYTRALPDLVQKINANPRKR